MGSLVSILVARHQATCEHCTRTSGSTGIPVVRQPPPRGRMRMLLSLPLKR